MKRKLKLFILSILIIGISIILINHRRIDNNILENTKEEKKVIYNGLAIMLEQDDNTYVEATDNSWQNDEYEFNTTLSKCENGGTLTYNPDTHKITLKVTGSDRCYVYFSKIKPLHEICNDNTLACVIAKKQGQAISGLPQDTEYNNKDYSGELLLHDGSIKASDGSILDAEDGGYRYSGDNPNNFVCFGPGAEDYSKGTSETCPDKNLYRIIGVFPFDENGNQLTKPSLYAKYLVKLIQSEYATKEQLGIESNGTPYTNNNEYTSLKRVKDIPQDGFYWNTTANNIWETSTLNKALNEGYLNYLKNKENNNTTWTDKIKIVKWNVKGGNESAVFNVQSKRAYINEMLYENENLYSQVYVTTKIGLIYIHDYGFTSDKSNWSTILNAYDTDANRQNNWLFNGVYEWTITNNNSFNYRGFGINYDARECGGTVNTSNFAVRPTFYLNEDIQYVGGDGTALTPYKIKIKIDN